MQVDPSDVRFLFPALLVAVAACTVGPDFEAPAPTAPNAWLEVDDDSLRSGAVDYGAWWSVFEERDLRRAVVGALNIGQRPAQVPFIEQVAHEDLGARLLEGLGPAVRSADESSNRVRQAPLTYRR